MGNEAREHVLQPALWSFLGARPRMALPDLVFHGSGECDTGFGSRFARGID